MTHEQVESDGSQHRGEEIATFKADLQARLKAALVDQGIPHNTSLEEIAEKKKELLFRRSLITAVIEMTEEELHALSNPAARRPTPADQL